jgi:predicted methyltransferase
MYKFSVITLALLLNWSASADDALVRAVDSDLRSPDFVQRDSARHPQAALEFFGIRPDMSVAEIWPSRGWWSEILAPYLMAEGRYYAVGFSLSAKRTPGWRKKMARELIGRFEENPDQFGKAIITSMAIPGDPEIAPPGSLDMVLTFRNVHNWMKGDYAPAVFETMYAALKHGGILGLVEHRAPDDADIVFMKLSGYVSEPHVIAMARAAGFELAAKSEINANPKDSKDHPAGVWSLPPSLRYCESLEDQAEAKNCRENYRSIGESDRMTLKFIKP